MGGAGGASIPQPFKLLEKTLQTLQGGLTTTQENQLFAAQKILDKPLPTDPNLLAVSKLQRAQAQATVDHLKSMQHEGGFADKFLAYQKKYEGQYNQQQLDTMKMNAPQLAQLQVDLQSKYGPQMAQAESAAMQAYDPEAFALRKQMQSQVTGKLGMGLSPQDMQFFREQNRVGQAQRGIFESPLGSEQEAYRMVQLNLAQQQQNLSNAGSVLSQSPFPGVPNFGIPQLSNALFQPPSFGGLLGMQGDAAGAQLAQQAQRQNAQASMAGSLGAIAGGTTAAIPYVGPFIAPFMSMLGGYTASQAAGGYQQMPQSNLMAGNALAGMLANQNQSSGWSQGSGGAMYGPGGQGIYTEG